MRNKSRSEYLKLWGSYKRCDVYVMGISKRERGEKGTEAIFEAIVTENFPKLVSDTRPQIQEAQRTPSKINSIKTICRHIISKLRKRKKILKEARGKEHLSYRGAKRELHRTSPQEPCKQEKNGVNI